MRLAPRTTLLAFAIGLALAVPATASGATTIGSVIPWSGNETLVCDDPGGCTVVPTSISGTPVAVPFDGVMVRWTALVPEGGDPVDLRVLRPAAGGYVPVAKSELQSVDPDGVFSQGVRIRVAAGDLIGLDLEHGEEIGISAHASEDSASLAFFPKLGDAGTRAPTDTYADDFEMHFRATIERDADNDGYGDETQDECPQLAQTVGGCPNGILELALDPARRFMPRKRHWDGVVIGETTRIQTSVRASTVHPVPGVAITFELGAGLAAVSAAGPAQCAVTPAKVSCPVGVMPNGSTATVSLDVRATSQDSGRIDARVTSAARTDGRKEGRAYVEILKVGPCSNLHQTARRPDPGTFGGDMLLGTTSADTFSGLDGDDCLFGKGANDMLSGGVGNDFLEGNFGNDRLQGEDGNDRLVGSPGSDSLDGGAGNDLLNADDRARDVVQCGPGHDRASVDRIDSVSGCEVVKRVPAAKKGKRPRRKR